MTEDHICFIHFIQAIEMERRFSKTLPHLDLDPALTDRVLALAVEREPGEGMLSIQ